MCVQMLEKQPLLHVMDFNNLSGFLLFQDLTFAFEFSLGQRKVKKYFKISFAEEITDCLTVLLSESNKITSQPGVSCFLVVKASFNVIKRTEIEKPKSNYTNSVRS